MFMHLRIDVTWHYLEDKLAFSLRFNSGFP